MILYDYRRRFVFRKPHIVPGFIIKSGRRRRKVRNILLRRAQDKCRETEVRVVKVKDSTLAQES